MKTAIVIPFRSTPDRERIFQYVYNRLKTEFVDIPIYVSDSREVLKFNVSQARNRGCLQAINDGVDILIVIDADTMFQRRDVEKAIRLAEKGVASMFRNYVRASKEETNSILAGGEIPKEFEAKMFRSTPGGLWVLPVEVFKTLNGWDERFIGWGYEDTAFNEAYKTVYGTKFRRIKANLISLFHTDRIYIINLYLKNEERYRLYKEISRSKDRESMLKLTEGNIKTYD